MTAEMPDEIYVMPYSACTLGGHRDGTWAKDRDVYLPEQIVTRYIRSTPQLEEARVGWRTIDSAPRDGTTIWGFWKNEYGDFQGPIHFGYCAYSNSDKWCFGEDGDGMNPAPTHWMPLPKPPNRQ